MRNSACRCCIAKNILKLCSTFLNPLACKKLWILDWLKQLSFHESLIVILEWDNKRA